MILEIEVYFNKNFDEFLRKTIEMESHEKSRTKFQKFFGLNKYKEV